MIEDITGQIADSTCGTDRQPTTPVEHAPILSWDHWPEEWRSFDLTDYRHGCLSGEEAHAWLTKALKSRSPSSLCSLSDADVALWAYQELSTTPGVQISWLDKLIHTTGVSRLHDRFLWPLLDHAYQQTPAWLVQNRWEIAARLSYCCMALKGVEIRREGFLYRGQLKEKIDCESVYSFVEEGLFLPAISGRKLAVLSGIHELLTERLISVGTTVTVSCPFPRSVETRKLKSVPQILETLFEADWDLLLCSAGGYSPLFCDYAARMGRQAFDIGSADAMLATGERFHAQFMKREASP